MEAEKWRTLGRRLGGAGGSGDACLTMQIPQSGESLQSRPARGCGESYGLRPLHGNRSLLEVFRSFSFFANGTCHMLCPNLSLRMRGVTPCLDDISLVLHLTLMTHEDASLLRRPAWRSLRMLRLQCPRPPTWHPLHSHFSYVLVSRSKHSCTSIAIGLCSSALPCDPHDRI